MVQKKQKSAIAYALFALFLGCFGVHKFYAGKIGLGFLFLGWIPSYIIAAICAATYAFDAAGIFTSIASIWFAVVCIWSFIDMIIGFCHASTPQKLFK